MWCFMSLLVKTPSALKTEVECLCPVWQEHGTILPMLVAGKTAQPAALTPLTIINEGFEQLEKLAAANLKGGVFQGECRLGLHQPHAGAVENLLGDHTVGAARSSARDVWRKCAQQQCLQMLSELLATLSVDSQPYAYVCWIGHADGDSASTAKARRKLAAAMCKRLQELLTCLRVLVGTVIAMPLIIDQQVRTSS